MLQEHEPAFPRKTFVVQHKYVTVFLYFYTKVCQPCFSSAANRPGAGPTYQKRVNAGRVFEKNGYFLIGRKGDTYLLESPVTEDQAGFIIQKAVLPPSVPGALVSGPGGLLPKSLHVTGQQRFSGS